LDCCEQAPAGRSSQGFFSGGVVRYALTRSSTAPSATRTDHAQADTLGPGVRGDCVGTARLKTVIGADRHEVWPTWESLDRRPNPPGSMTTRSGSSSVGASTRFRLSPGSIPTSPTASAATRAGTGFISTASVPSRFPSRRSWKRSTAGRMAMSRSRLWLRCSKRNCSTPASGLSYSNEAEHAMPS